MGSGDQTQVVRLSSRSCPVGPTNLLSLCLSLLILNFPVGEILQDLAIVLIMVKSVNDVDHDPVTFT